MKVAPEPWRVTFAERVEIEETPLMFNVLSGPTTQVPTPSVPLETRPEFGRSSVPLGRVHRAGGVVQGEVDVGGAGARRLLQRAGVVEGETAGAVPLLGS